MKRETFVIHYGYQIGSYGTIKNLKGRVLKYRVDTHGYATLWLGSQLHKVHRLVAEAHIPNYHNKPQVNHIDGDKLNNSVENLEWSTARENIQHAHATGLSSLRKLSRDEVIVLRVLSRLKTHSQAELGRAFGVGSSTVSEIVSGKRYASVV